MPLEFNFQRYLDTAAVAGAAFGIYYGIVRCAINNKGPPSKRVPLIFQAMEVAACACFGAVVGPVALPVLAARAFEDARRELAALPA